MIGVLGAVDSEEIVSRESMSSETASTIAANQSPSIQHYAMLRRSTTHEAADIPRSRSNQYKSERLQVCREYGDSYHTGDRSNVCLVRVNELQGATSRSLTHSNVVMMVLVEVCTRAGE